MQNNNNFFISEELLDVFDEKSLIDKKEIDELVYEIKSDNIKYKCKVIKFKSLKNHNRITLKSSFDILSCLYLKKKLVLL